MKDILIVEDLPPTRDWLERICCNAFPDAICRLADSLHTAQKTLSERPIDLAVLDLDLPDGRGIDLIAPIKAQNPDALCVVATISADNADVVAALAMGADGYLLKEQHEDLIQTQLMNIGMGIPPLSPAIAQRIMLHFRNTGPVLESHNLTQRETDVLSLIGRGMRNAEVADSLGISASTVAGYIKAIYRKLGISSRAEAAWHSRQMGL